MVIVTIIFIKNTFTVGGEPFIQPGFEGVVIPNETEPPLMRDLMHADGGEIVACAASVLTVKIRRKENHSVIFHAVVHVQLDDGEALMRIWSKLR